MFDILIELCNHADYYNTVKNYLRLIENVKGSNFSYFIYP